MKDKDYLPVNIEFDITDSGKVPESLGSFPNIDEVNKFINENLIATNHKLRAVRFMDNKEKKLLREEYQDLLELKIPLLERDLKSANSEYNEAKSNLADAKEILNATINEVKTIASEVKAGVIDIELDDKKTWRLACEDKYYFFTFTNEVLTLAKVKDIPEREKQEIFNAMSKNEFFFKNPTKKKKKVITVVKATNSLTKKAEKEKLLSTLNDEELKTVAKRLKIAEWETIELSKLKNLILCNSINNILAAF